MKLDIFKQKWIDMVFEGRNKSYGAYELRKKNPRTTLIALAIGASVFATALALPLINFGDDSEEEKEKVTMVDMANIVAPPEPPKIIPPVAPPPPPAPKIDEVKFVKPKVVKKEEVVEEIKTIEELKDKNVGTKDVEGKDDGKIVIDAPSGDGPQTDSKIVEDSNQIYTAVEVKPDFPGGLQKFYDFVGKNYKVPEDEDIKGKVFVQFVVERDGTLTDIKVIRDLGFGTGKEAIRVLKKSPKWKPGIQNGRPVRVLYSLPISIVSGN
ncbi:MAG: energy transducer TonB [Flavobacterium sp.]|nr:MAG: energy transducer TonB [Flavobacterium sp.]